MSHMLCNHPPARLTATLLVCACVVIDNLPPPCRMLFFNYMFLKPTSMQTNWNLTETIFQISPLTYLPATKVATRWPDQWDFANAWEAEPDRECLSGSRAGSGVIQNKIVSDKQEMNFICSLLFYQQRVPSPLHGPSVIMAVFDIVPCDLWTSSSLTIIIVACSSCGQADSHDRNSDVCRILLRRRRKI